MGDPTAALVASINGHRDSWLPVVGYEGIYEVSARGHVRGVNRTDASGHRRKGSFLRPSTSDSGHLQVKLYRNGVASGYSVHRLVLEAFVGPCPEGMEACHWDDNPTNNQLENLRWDTHRENVKDRIRNGHDHNGQKMRCSHGHLFDEASTYVTSDGKRQCRICNARRKRDSYKPREQETREEAGHGQRSA